jgi:hypothetical protein
MRPAERPSAIQQPALEILLNGLLEMNGGTFRIVLAQE